MNLCRLIYKSKTSWDILSNETLTDLATRSARRNSAADITGMLILSGESFLQVLEGPDEAVNRLYAKIMRDELHSEVTLLTYEQIPARSFADWSMRIVDLNDLPIAERNTFRRKYDDTEGYVEIPNDTLRAVALLFDAKAVCLAEG
ncbi:MAG: BLUF domain-containing protein [Verrucomicrobiota bacterium]